MTSLKTCLGVQKYFSNFEAKANKGQCFELPIKFGPGFENLKKYGQDVFTLQNDAKTLQPQPNYPESFAAKKLKKFYDSEGFNYLLPNEVWSDKKIFAAIKILGKQLDRLEESNNLNKKTIQQAVETIAPQTKGRIVIKDFKDAEKYLRASGHSEAVIKHHLNKSAAITISDSYNNTIYLKMDKLKGSPVDKIHLKGSIEHEVKHALTGTLQNVRTEDNCKNTYYKCDNQDAVFNKIFNVFEVTYNKRTPNIIEHNINTQTMLETLGFDSVKALHDDFDKTLNKLVKEEQKTGELNLGSDRKSWKQFFNSLKNSAKDEKEAYWSNRRYRELFKEEDEKLEVPTGNETTTLIYKEMEDFFAQKRIQANKLFPKDSQNINLKRHADDM